MLQAYVIDHKRTDLLDTAQGLSKWLSDKYSENSVYVLNYLQCIRCRRDFINDEIKALNNISNQNPDNITIQFDVQKIEYDAAMAMLYASSIYDKKSDIETGLYRESPAYVYGLFQDEMNFGKIVQAELYLHILDCIM